MQRYAYISQYRKHHLSCNSLHNPHFLTSLNMWQRRTSKTIKLCKIQYHHLFQIILFWQSTCHNHYRYLDQTSGSLELRIQKDLSSFTGTVYQIKKEWYKLKVNLLPPHLISKPVIHITWMIRDFLSISFHYIWIISLSLMYYLMSILVNISYSHHGTFIPVTTVHQLILIHFFVVKNSSI